MRDAQGVANLGFRPTDNMNGLRCGGETVGLFMFAFLLGCPFDQAVAQKDGVLQMRREALKSFAQKRLYDGDAIEP